MRLAEGQLPLTHSYGVTRTGFEVGLYGGATQLHLTWASRCPLVIQCQPELMTTGAAFPACPLISASHATSLFGMPWYITGL